MEPDGPPGAAVFFTGGWFTGLAEKTDAYLDRRLPSAAAEPAVLHEAMRYAVFSGGKRLRPVLVLASSAALGGSPEKALPAAGAVELIHTYSLVHDDLPAMDDDDYRRGRPTVHKVFGEAVAILAGDALLTMAFELISDDLARSSGAGAAAAVGRELAVAAGSTKLIGGQVVDLLSEGMDPAEIDGAHLENIHRAKTGALFTAAVRTGAIIAEARPDELRALTSYAGDLGLAFQIADDILDVVGDAAETGRPAGRDEARGKVTFPALFGLEEARRLARRHAEKAIDALKPLQSPSREKDVHTRPLEELALFAVRRRH